MKEPNQGYRPGYLIFPGLGILLYEEGWDQVTFEAFSLKLYDSMNILLGARKVAKEQLLVDR